MKPSEADKVPIPQEEMILGAEAILWEMK